MFIEKYTNYIFTVKNDKTASWVTATRSANETLLLA
jgi:hypothetical protein